MGARRDKIQSWGLFGESAHLPDVMHCETIAARSVRHDWEFAPHRHARLHQLLLLESGSGTVHLEGQSLPLTPMSLVNVPAGDVHGYRFAKGTQGFVATLADEMLDQLLAGAAEARRSLARACVVAAEPPVAATLQQIWQEFSGRSVARALVLRGLCATLLGLAARALAQAEAPQSLAQQSQLMQRFEALIETHYLRHWKVADYARALAITPTHLSRVARAATGQPASRLIDARMVREARRNLAYTNMSVSSIASALGFADPAYFSRVFTRTLGLSPRGFRAQISA